MRKSAHEGIDDPGGFLDNRHPAAVVLDGHTYPTVAHAYQAAKTLDPALRRRIRGVADPDGAIGAGRRARRRPGWPAVKVPLMRSLLAQKFTDLGLRQRLLDTGTAALVYDNQWNDTFWGRCGGAGHNHLGRILMAIRAGAWYDDGLDRSPCVERLADTRLPTRYGQLRAVGYRDFIDGREHIALLYGDVKGGAAVPVRIHSECLSGDVLGSLRCDCGQQLDLALQAIVEHGYGVVIYLRGHEGRGIGLLAKLWTHELQDSGLDTVDANLALGLPIDSRDFRVGAAILEDLGVMSVRLLTNNPEKRRDLESHGIRILEQVPLSIEPCDENRRYLEAKRTRLGHDLRYEPSGAPATST
jgi:GTP cyclohydrolase II